MVPPLPREPSVGARQLPESAATDLRMRASFLNHKKMIEEALLRLVDLALERDRIEHEICNLQIAARARLDLIEGQAERHAMEAALGTFDTRLGVTDLAKLCLQYSAEPMTAGQVKTFIMLFGHEAGLRASLLQEVHTTLLRLSKDVVSAGKNQSGYKSFRLLTIAEKARNAGVADEPAKREESKLGKKIHSRLRRSAWYDTLTELLKASKVRGRRPASTLDVGEDQPSELN